MLLTYGTGNRKLAKSDKNSKYLSCGLSLIPYKYSGHNVCPNATKGCYSTCINFAGMGKFHSVQKARLNKTKMFFEQRKFFIDSLFKELHQFNKKCKFARKKGVVRLNIFSDLRWEKLCPELFTEFKDFIFNDYTKIVSKYQDFLDHKLPVNYYLTFSRSELNHAKSLEFLQNGGNVAMVFRGELPTQYAGFKCVNGDLSDLRFLDKKNTICALKAKGRAKQDTTGFVIDYASAND